MKSKGSSRSFNKRLKELEKVSTRIEVKMTKLERIIDKMFKSLA